MSARHVVLALLVGSCHHPRFPTATIQVGEHAVRVEVAADVESRARGLMHREHLPADEGMLFIYPEERPRSFWMKDTRIPLSIAFADSTGKIVRISEMRPLSTERTKSLYPARYALEMNQGWFERRSVARGDYISEIPEVEVE